MLREKLTNVTKFGVLGRCKDHFGNPSLQPHSLLMSAVAHAVQQLAACNAASHITLDAEIITK
eukprot:4556778-Amphidinium_carterae.1